MANSFPFRCKHLRTHPVVLSRRKAFRRVGNDRPGREVLPGEIVDFVDDPSSKGPQSGWELLRKIEEETLGTVADFVGAPTLEQLREARENKVAYVDVKRTLDELCNGLSHRTGWDGLIEAYAQWLVEKADDKE